ncbi:MAG TPA: YoaK family protein [Reyranella sp.]|nr:YoaK family protein [Reyranella sp.]
MDDRSLGLFNWQEMGTSSDNTVWQACLLAIVAGYADAVGFLGFNAFAGAMTGNTVLLGIALATDKLADAAQSVAIIAAFLAGVAASALLRRHVSLAAILVIEMATIVVAALVTPPVAAPVLAFAMGLQNAAMTHFAGLSLNTVFLTGNLQKLVETLLRRDAGSTSEGVAVALLSRLWLAYLAGVVLGALAWTTTAYPLLFAVLPLPVVLLRRAAWRIG